VGRAKGKGRGKKRGWEREGKEGREKVASWLFWGGGKDPLESTSRNDLSSTKH